MAYLTGPLAEREEYVGWVERSEPHHFRRTTDDGRRAGVLPSVARLP
jgi:hypothetical protein